ncbi:hypothetical protein [Ureibacillus sinduriensis]|uniref:Uncharacterized protein n=1 Tax=Ureibacillus sinduriensis BLB-1 = JCM 15800 TaxID=1384057 RepID=A0A0A3I0T7_9BACL|nr:hypothetical protein [Ureibacillus sinduriensis]KGR76248.1 hypothetical protein CD33_06790 [Ureibacillus sinduriensis BLB-1 = JCM 15800]
MEYESFRYIVFVNGLIVLLIITLLIKKAYRKWSIAIMLAYTIVYAAIIITAPLIKEKKYEEFLAEVENQLAIRYPTEEWTMKKDINFYSFPYDFLVEVSFQEEPNVIYGFVLDEEASCMNITDI